MNNFNSFSPTEFRYRVEDLEDYLSEEAFIKYKAKVEATLVRILAQYGLCPQEIVDNVEKAVEKISASEVYYKEKELKHDIRSLVEVMKNNVSEKAKPFIHLTATSYDIINITNAIRYKEAFYNVIIPDMINLERIFIKLARKEKKILQIGRTHGQHAEPITFGFFIAQYVDRWGNRIQKIKKSLELLSGKFSGSVGSYNALSLFLDNPERFEKDILTYFRLKPANISSQNISPEPLLDLLHSVISSWGVLANYANDMRHLHRTEISEISENFDSRYIGSSTMPHKQNPLNFENIISAWKKFMPNIITFYMSQISEHQGDLTNSLSLRYIPEMMVMFDSTIRRAIRISKNLKVNKSNLEKNFLLNAHKIIAEPLQILLSQCGFSKAFELVQNLILNSDYKKESLKDFINENNLKQYLNKLDDKVLKILYNPKNYIGFAIEKTDKVCDLWEKRIDKIENDIISYLH